MLTCGLLFDILLLRRVKTMAINLSILRELRIKAGLTRRELADRIGCREHTIVRWELGTSKKPLSPYRIALEDFYKEVLLK